MRVGRLGPLQEKHGVGSGPQGWGELGSPAGSCRSPGFLRRAGWGAGAPGRSFWITSK